VGGWLPKGAKSKSERSIQANVVCQEPAMETRQQRIGNQPSFPHSVSTLKLRERGTANMLAAGGRGKQ